MCGIFGIIKKEKFNEDYCEFIEKTMVSLESRGRDAFGYFISPSMIHGRAATSVSEYIALTETKKLDIAGDSKDNNIFLGHTRAKTTGDERTIFNNHPFPTKDFVLAHNGCISNHEFLKKEFKLNYKEETDSFIIVALIQKFYDAVSKSTVKKTTEEKILEAIERTMDKLGGGYSCWLHHRKTKRTYLFKSSYSALIVATDSKNDDYFIFCSEEDTFTKHLPDKEEKKPKTRNKYMRELFKSTEDILIKDLKSEKCILAIGETGKIEYYKIVPFTSYNNTRKTYDYAEYDDDEDFPMTIYNKNDTLEEEVEDEFSSEFSSNNSLTFYGIPISRLKKYGFRKHKFNGRSGLFECELEKTFYNLLPKEYVINTGFKNTVFLTKKELLTILRFFDKHFTDEEKNKVEEEKIDSEDSEEED